MFTRRLALTTLIELCRMLKHQLGAGLSLHRVLTQQSVSGPSAVRALAGRLGGTIRQGTSLSKALDAEKDYFPPLFLSLVKLGEETGHLAEIFGELERYYQLELQLRRQFRSQTFMPVVQFVLAVLLLAGLIYLLGYIAVATNSPPLLTIFGLSGGPASVAFLLIVFGSIYFVWIAFVTLRRLGRQKGWMDRMLLAAPALGPCLTALVMSRFALALQLTLDTGLSVTKALRLAVDATGNAHFTARTEIMLGAVKKGQTLHDALVASELFGDDFLNVVASSEASGQVPEMMRHQAQQFHDEAARKMTLLTGVAAGIVWGSYAIFMIWAIFRLAGIYLRALGG